MKKTKVYFWALLLVGSFISSRSFAASVDLKLDLKFAVNKAQIQESGREALSQLLEVLSSFPEAKILISGHTDSLGSDTYNENLSVKRAEAVRAALISKGVDELLISSKGFGESAPIDSNETPSGRANNRRVVASLIGLSPEEVKKLSYILSNGAAGARVKGLEIIEEDSNAVSDFKENIENTPDESLDVSLAQENDSAAEIVLPETDEKDDELETVAESDEASVTKKKIKAKEKKQFKYYVTGYLGPHWSSQYSEDDVDFEHGRFTALSFGIDLGVKISRRWFADAYFYYLPTEVSEGSSGIDFSKGDSIKYQNDIYGVRAGYIWKGSQTYRLSLITGLVSHTFGGLERSGVNTYIFNKYEHTGLTLGFRLEKKITKNWAFDSDLAYILPLSVSDVEDGKGTLWYRGILGVKRKLSERLRLSIEYQAVYHESDFTFASGYKSKPEFFVQTFMLGLKYRF